VDHDPKEIEVGFFKRLKSNVQDLERAREVVTQPGFADMVRSGQDAYAEMQSGGEMGQLVADAQRTAALATSGVPTPATLVSVERVARPQSGIGPGGAPPGFGPAGAAPTLGVSAALPPRAKIDVKVHPQGEPAYAASFTQSLSEQVLTALRPGATITVRVDPGDPSSMMLWGMPG
jgi:hypothetical protein